MDRQLAAPLRIVPTTPLHPLSSTDTYNQLRNFLPSLPAGSSRAQLERLVDSLGVEVGLVEPDESERREEARRAERAKRRAERRKAKEEAERLAREEDLAGEVEGLLGGAGAGNDEADEEELEMGAGGEGDGDDRDGMSDRGDVEYGDVVDEEDDEPDNEEGGMEVDRD